VKILVLGGDGMLGHQLLESWRVRHDVRVTLRDGLERYRELGLFSDETAVGGVDVRNLDRLRGVIETFRPDAVVNAVGVVKQRAEAKEIVPSLEINALFPHYLAALCRAAGARLVHLSTDCVFSGEKGNYTEQDPPDPVDLYGQTKLLGELSEPPAVTLRTSIIGLELRRKTGLVEWYLAQKGAVRGFRRAIYSGFTTAEMAGVIEMILERFSTMTGVWHVASAPISKYDLLRSLTEKLDRTDIRVEADDQLVCDRSLSSSAFSQKTAYRAPGWDVMLDSLADQIRRRKDANR
jgi:dTDP-4-dehydrorhamnose reductase